MENQRTPEPRKPTRSRGRPRTDRRHKTTVNLLPEVVEACVQIQEAELRDNLSETINALLATHPEVEKRRRAA
jgi:hypothetical protein